MLPSGEALLHVQGLEVGYGPITAVRRLDLHVEPGEVVALLGPNGAGKSSALRGISGVVRPRSGRVRFAGQRIDSADPRRIVAAGLAHVPEGRRVFAGLSVEENLDLGGWALHRQPARFREQRALVHEMFPRLVERRQQLAGSLSGGEQQMLAIGRALMAGPKLLMIDELSLGLAPIVVAELLSRLMDLHRTGLALLLIEQFVHRALEVAERVYVLQKGRVVFNGSVEDARSSDILEAAYMTGVT